MANFCLNFVTLQGSQEQVERFDLLMKSAKDEGQCFILETTKSDLYMFDFEIVNDFIYQFQTKWTPQDSFNYLLEISKDFKDLVITLSYEEFGCNLFGKYVIINGTYTLKSLDEELIENEIVFDDDNCTYSYKDFESESISELCDMILETV